MSEYRIFLSHHNSDKPIIREAGLYLAACGIEPIFDEWSFRKGQSLRSEIEHSIKRSTGFVLFWSRKAAASSYVQFEDELAFTKRFKNQAYITQVVRLDNTCLPERYSFLIYHDWQHYKLGSEEFLSNLSSLARSIMGLPDIDAPPVTFSRLEADKKGLKKRKIELLQYKNNLLEDQKEAFRVYERALYDSEYHIPVSEALRRFRQITERLIAVENDLAAL